MSVFTIGSCFARNIEKALITNGIDVIGSDFCIDSSKLQEKIGLNNIPNQRSILNKYSTHSIYFEVNQVLNEGGRLESGFLNVGDELYVDPQLAAVLKPLSIESLLDVREDVNSLVSRIVEADLVFITLRLAETWQDMQTKAYLNSSPPPQLMLRDEKRFLFQAAEYGKTLLSLRNALLLIKEKSKRDVRFVITVSPVPMATTWTSHDVIVANTFSKSILRVVAQQLFEEFQWVDYFPSYEFVLNSPRSMSFGDDELHIRQEMVGYIVDKFISNYIVQ